MIKLGNNVHPHLKNDVADQTTLSSTEIETKVSTEVTRASEAEVALSGRIVAESERASEAEAHLSDKIDAEKSRAEASEMTLTDNLASEIAERKSALQEEASARASGISSEKTRAEAAEKTLTDNLAAEVKAREDAISKEVSDRNAAILTAVQGLDVALKGADGSYIETIKEVDGELTATVQEFDKSIDSTSDDKCAPTTKAVYTAIDAEKTRAEAAEKTLTDNLAAEITRAKAAEKTLTDNLSAEVTRAKAAEKTLTNNLSAEVTRAKAAEKTLTDNLAAEVTNRATAITNAINALNVPDTAVAGKYISQVSETNGEIAVTRASFSSAVTSGDKNAPSGDAVYKAIQGLGTLYHIEASVADKAALDALDTKTLKAGEVRNVNDTGDNYVWTGTAWDRLGGSTVISALNFPSPAASGTTTSFIDTVSQSDGEISATKKTITSASTSAKGIVQLSSATNSTSETLAATAKAVKTVQDAVKSEASARATAISTEVTNRDEAISTAISTEVSDRNTAISNAIAALDGTITGTAGVANTVTALSEKDGKVSATFGAIQIAQSQVTGLSDALAGKQASGSYKTTQTAVSDPIADGTSATFIDTISQNANGIITATKKTVRTMGAATASAAGTAGLVPAPAAGKQGKYLRGDGTWATPTNTTYSTVSKSAAGLCPTLPNETTTTKYLRQDGTWATPTNTTYSTANSTTLGLVKSSTTGTTANRDYKVQVNSDGTMKVNVPWTDTNTTYSNMTAATSTAAGKAGLVPAPAAGNQDKYLRGDGTWATPTSKTYSVASTTADGLMSKADKTKLNSLNLKGSFDSSTGILTLTSV